MADAVAQGDHSEREAPLVLPPVKKTLQDKKKNETYTVGKFIGEGGFARCYEAKSETKGTVCCKTLWKAKLRNATDRARTRLEVTIHRKLNHPNIVKLQAAFEDEDYVYIMMEICRRGSLKELIDRRKSLTEPEVRYYALQLLGALKYLMDKRVIHRDLKLANVFISDDMTLRLGDFGLAGQLSEGENRKNTRCGTPNYTAPEVLNNTGHSYEVDMWAFGVILYTLLVGIPPFQAKSSLSEIYYKIRTVDMSFPKDTKISDEARDIVTLILQANPDDRPTIEQVREHPFFKGFTPHTLSRDALCIVPQFTEDPEFSLKRSLDCDGFARPSLIPGPSTPHKKARFGQSLRIVPPVPLPLPHMLNTVHQAEEENNIPTSNKPKGTVYGNIVNNFHAVKHLIELGHSTSDIENQIGYADQSIPNFISKWQTEGKSGYTYQFIDGTKGVLFPNLATLCASSDLDYFEYIKCTELDVTSVSRFDKASFQQSHPEKYSLFRARIAKLDDILPAIQSTLRDTLLPPALIKPKPIGLSAADPTRAQLSYTTKINLSKHATFIRLSDGSVQMILNGEQFILTDKGRSIFLISKKGTSIHKYKLVDILYHEARDIKSGGAINSGRQELYKRLNYFVEISTLIYNRSQQKKSSLPGKSALSNNA